jgi:pyruvate carboxylase subunit B
MKYTVTVNGSDSVVELDGENVLLDGASARVRLGEADDGPERILTVGEDVHRVFVRPGDTRGRYTLWVDGFRFEVEALDERSRAIRELSAATTAPKGPAPLVAPMPGMIVRINVNEGDVVKPGQGLVVMEAMKMENELRASAGGAVRRVLVAPGTAVEKGALLLEME